MSSRKWRSKQELTDEDVVTLFLKTQKHWFNPEMQIPGLPRNSLCGKQEYAEAALMNFLETGNYPQNGELLYVVEKFEREWIGADDGMFEEIT
jgi:hypothetical protein